MKRFAQITIVIVVLGVLAVFAITAARHWRASNPHSVTLTWQPGSQPKDVKILGYNIYRKTQPDGEYEKLASQVGCCSYIDQKVTSGSSYSYVVRAVDAAGHESPDSTEINAKIP